jgi:hypothetical protein
LRRRAIDNEKIELGGMSRQRAAEKESDQPSDAT